VFHSKQGLGRSGNSCASNPDEHACDSRVAQRNTQQPCSAKRHRRSIARKIRGTAEPTPRRWAEISGVASAEADVRVVRHHSGRSHDPAGGERNGSRRRTLPLGGGRTGGQASGGWHHKPSASCARSIT
jgi:hypothetical protein